MHSRHFSRTKISPLSKISKKKKKGWALGSRRTRNFPFSLQLEKLNGVYRVKIEAKSYLSPIGYCVDKNVRARRRWRRRHAVEKSFNFAGNNRAISKGREEESTRRRFPHDSREFGSANNGQREGTISIPPTPGDPRRRSNFRDHFVIKPRKAALLFYISVTGRGGEENLIFVD